MNRENITIKNGVIVNNKTIIKITSISYKQDKRVKTMKQGSIIIVRVSVI